MSAAEPAEGRDAQRDRHVGRFRDETSRRRYMTAYDDALAAWPVRPEALDVATRYGSTHVLRAGPSHGAPIVLIHAVAVASPSWFANVAALAEDHPVFAIDTIGDVGRSAQTARVRDGADLSLWLEDVLGALDLHGAHCVGLSYGGWVVLNQARRSVDRVASVTAVDPAGAIGRGKGSFLIKIIPDAILASVGKSDRALGRLMSRLNNGTVPEEPLLELSIAGLRTFRAKQPYPRRMSDDALREIQIPALLFFCECSPVNHAVAASQRSQRLIAHSRTEVVPDAGHMLPIEKPDLFASRVLSFIHDVDSKDHTA